MDSVNVPIWGAGSNGEVIGTLYAFVDGLVGGWIFAWLYNRLIPRRVSGKPVI